MLISSPVVQLLPVPVGPGGQLDIPDGVLGSIELPLPMVNQPGGASVDLRGVPGSCIANRFINQGASAAGSSVDLAILDKGLFSLQGSGWAINFVGPVPSSANPSNVGVNLINPEGTFQLDLMRFPTIINPVAAPFCTFGPYVISFSQAGWKLRLTSFNATGVGESMGAEACCYIKRLL
jgi:hypothetical protein